MMVGRTHKRIACLFFLTAVLLYGCYKECLIEESKSLKLAGRVLALDDVFASCDKVDHIMLYTIPSDTLRGFSPHVSFGDYESVEIEGRKLIENQINELGDVTVNKAYAVKARMGKKIENYQLFFTTLPLLHIHTDNPITDEPKVLSWMELCYPLGGIGETWLSFYEGYAGIEIRGRTSAVHEKKSYGLELWESGYGKDHSASLLGMREGEDWILDAMYVDPLRMRNRVSFEVWKSIWDKKIQTPFRTEHPGIRSEYVELFINQRYMGLYCLSEKLDEALLCFSEPQAGDGAALYKAFRWDENAPAFGSYNSIPGYTMTWEGWEQIYPENKSYWEPLSELRKVVVFDADEEFREHITGLINLEAAADYYIFINLILAHDNVHKNYFLARYGETSAFLWLPWDLEGSWGIMWHGGQCQYSGLLLNNLFHRLIDLDVSGFNNILEHKWDAYREDIFKEEELTSAFIRYADLLARSGAIDREIRRWPGVDLDLNVELAYVQHLIAMRLEYLDKVFD